ncbi:helicase-exonuclease AddAB subunit AddA [Fructobacillus durionis]|uniref:ATP-dependent helicase/nuclease subunit A n=1 Tax=Fructobacillus durionis TaxID=283737 RepID=A0A1I1E133_9LACO|nr:helicase-exonuclease AddAB subunit AddA [Fructobacillus durionis]SFB80777.1 DNA helicase/exodeoxyribonuclease V, subunit A [Fructobacillus durionis]
MPEFTDSQKAAIEQAGHNILVSASAGSGKTTVLIERLIRKIMAGTSVDKFLIVTFTRAAAGEMKDRLEAALTKRLQTEEDQDTRVYLQEQLALLPTAAVTTIDGFALKLIESYYYEIDLDPAFRLVADSAEEALFKNRVLDGLFDELFDESHSKHQAFLQVLENFASVSRSQNLKDIILKLANFDIARPEEDNWLDSLTESYDGSLSMKDQKAYQNYLTGEVRPLVEEALNDLPVALSAVEGEENDKSIKMAESLLEVQGYLQKLLYDLDEGVDYDQMKSDICVYPKKFPGRYQQKKIEASEDTAALAEAIEPAMVYRERYFAGKDAPIASIANSFFRLTEEQWQTVNARSQRIVSDLVMVTKEYLAALKKAKAEANILYFSDLVVLARQILKNDEIRQLVQGQFAEVMVDEYQDVNRLQEAFLKDMSNGHNMYMVGDIKQSIYGFRQAAPQLFANKYSAFAKDENDDERIELAENFRSENNVTKVINLIFTQIMDQELGDVAYEGSAKLIAKAAFPDDVPPVFNLDLLAIKQGKKSQSDDADDGDGDDDRETREKTLTYLLKKVQEIRAHGQVYDKNMGMRPVQYSDIAILTRSKTSYPDLLRLAHQAGIPIQSESVGDYYKAMEVYVVLDILRILDNPHQDIPLAAVLRSPIYGYDENDLAKVRLADKAHDFYMALKADAKENEKSQKVLDDLAAWRVYASQNDLVGLIWAIYQDTGWLDYVAGLAGGAQRQANLHALYQRATTFQENGQSGLFAFIAYIEEVQDSGGNVGEVAQETSNSALSLMTIHKSKGLEFPIVILPELDKRFNDMDMKSAFVLQKDAGIGLDYLEPNAKVKVPNLGKYAVKQSLKRQSWSEEMRLYYVALTRAKQQLYLIGRIDPLEDKETAEAKLYKNAVESTEQFLPESQRLKAKSYLDWTLQSFARLEIPSLQQYFMGDEKPLHQLLSGEKNGSWSIEAQVIAEEDIPKQEDLKGQLPKAERDETENEARVKSADFDAQLLKDKLSYRYPYEAATKTAAYQSVSEIKQLFEDPDRPYLEDLYLDENGQAVEKPDEQTVETDALDEKSEQKAANMLTKQELPMPAFMTDGKVKPSPTAVGTATHLIMQLLNFEAWIDESDLQDMVDRLVATGKIAKEVAPLINLGQIIDFLRTDFADTIARHNDTLKREAPFAMIIPAKRVYQNVDDEEPILIHGIIDGYFVDEAKKTVTIFDYKTDFVPKRAGERQRMALQRMKKNYTGQLNLYRQALQDEYPDYEVLPGRLILLSAGMTLDLD